MNVPTGCVPSRNAQTVAIREAVQPLRALGKESARIDVTLVLTNCPGKS